MKIDKQSLTRFLAHGWMNLVLPIMITMGLIMVMSVTIMQLTKPDADDPLVMAHKAAEKEARTIDASTLVYDKGVAVLMEGIYNGFEFLMISRDGSLNPSVTLLFSKKGEKSVHHLVLPGTTYNNIETTYLLPRRINFEVATEAFLMKNSNTLSGARSAPKEMDWSRELYISFGIGCCVAIIWMMTAPIRNERRSNPAPLNRKIEITGKAIDPSKIAGGMEDLVGLNDIKAEIMQIEDMIKHPAKYKAHNIDRPFNILMSGPAGTGKTKMASYLAKVLDVPMFSQAAGSLETGLIGGGSETLNGVYNEARKHPMSIVFLDEGQVLLAKRGQETGRKNADDTSNTLLTILDGTNTTDQSQVITIVASNFSDNTLEMDPAMLRRFPLKVDFRLPNLEERREIIKFYLDKKEASCVAWENTNLNYLADITAGMSPATLNTLTDRASLISISENKPIDTPILFRAFERCSVGLTNRAKTAGRDVERRRISIHELGHFFTKVHPLIDRGLSWNEIKEKSDFLKISTEAVERIGALGYVLSSPSDVMLTTLSSMEHEITSLYGGAAAEEVFFGKEDLSVGSSNDFEKATQLLDTIVNKLSMHSVSKLNYRMLKVESENGLKMMEEHSARLYERSLRVVALYRSTIDKLTEVLMAEYVMTKDELFSWLEVNFDDVHQQLVLDPTVNMKRTCERNCSDPEEHNHQR